MSSVAGFQPDWVSPPGDTIRDILKERGIAQSELAAIIGFSAEETQNLLDGRVRINIGLARQLKESLGGSVEFWIARDFQYREDASRSSDDDGEVEWLESIPVNDMVKFGWLHPPPSPSEELSACLRFFGVGSVVEWKRAYRRLEENVALRTSPTFDSSPASVAVWLRQGEIASSGIDCAPWDRDSLSGALPTIRRMTRLKRPSTFVPKLRDCLAMCGVALAIVRAPRGCKASGAVRFVESDRALVQLSFRYLADDHFWFSVFHELAHLLIHDLDDHVVLEQPNDRAPTKEEEEANQLASRIIIPDEHRAEFMKLRSNSKAVVRFAHKIGIAPGIVVGQLQHFERIDRSHLNGLKRRFEWR